MSPPIRRGGFSDLFVSKFCYKKGFSIPEQFRYRCNVAFSTLLWFISHQELNSKGWKFCVILLPAYWVYPPFKTPWIGSWRDCMNNRWFERMWDWDEILQDWSPVHLLSIVVDKISPAHYWQEISPAKYNGVWKIWGFLRSHVRSLGVLWYFKKAKGSWHRWSGVWAREEQKWVERRWEWDERPMDEEKYKESWEVMRRPYRQTWIGQVQWRKLDYQGETWNFTLYTWIHCFLICISKASLCSLVLL